MFGCKNNHLTAFHHFHRHLRIVGAQPGRHLDRRHPGDHVLRHTAAGGLHQLHAVQQQRLQTQDHRPAALHAAADQQAPSFPPDEQDADAAPVAVANARQLHERSGLLRRASVLRFRLFSAQREADLHQLYESVQTGQRIAVLNQNFRPKSFGQDFFYGKELSNVFDAGTLFFLSNFLKPKFSPQVSLM